MHLISLNLRDQFWGDVEASYDLSRIDDDLSASLPMETHEDDIVFEPATPDASRQRQAPRSVSQQLFMSIHRNETDPHMLKEAHTYPSSSGPIAVPQLGTSDGWNEWNDFSLGPDGNNLELALGLGEGELDLGLGADAFGDVMNDGGVFGNPEMNLRE